MQIDGPLHSIFGSICLHPVCTVYINSTCRVVVNQNHVCLQVYMYITL